MNYHINVKIEPYLTQDQKTIAILCYYTCPIDMKTESIIYTHRGSEDIKIFIDKLKQLLFVNQELNYEIKKRLITKIKKKNRAQNRQDDLKQLQEAFANNQRIELNIEIKEDDLL